MSKKIIALLLCILTALPLSLFGCGEAPADDVETTGAPDTAAETTTAAPETTTEEVTTADPLADNLPDKKFDGYNFRIGATEKESRWYDYLVRSEQNGEVLNDAIYKANTTVSERFGVKFTWAKMAQSNTNTYKTFVSNAQAGDDTFHWDPPLVLITVIIYRNGG